MTEPHATAPEERPVGELSYEEAREELVAVVQALESGQTTLERSLSLWERGTALADRCEEWLAGAKTRLDAVRATAPSDEADSEASQQQ